MAVDRKRIVVLGAGPGGYAAAFLAADQGHEVTLVDRAAQPGGVCLYHGCIPSKALLHVAKLLAETREAARWGIHFEAPHIDLGRLREWKNEVIGKLSGGLGRLTKARKIRYVQGRFAFESPERVRVQPGQGKAEALSFDAAILASGSHAIRIPGLPESPHVWDAEEALRLPALPKRLLVVGGGYIGLELGTVYAALGAQVTVVEMTAGLLPGADRDLVKILEATLRERFEAILLNTKVQRAEEDRGGMRVTLSSREGEHEVHFDKVLVAVGRRPNSADLGLESAGVTLTERQFVKVDASRQTDAPGIFAIGDVAGEPMLAHKAAHEAHVAVDAIGGEPAVFEPRAIPAVVFTDPEIAWCGLSETQARETGREIKVASFPWQASGRAQSLGRPKGLTKLVLDPLSDQVLGVGIAGSGAGELIAEGVLAVEMGAVAPDLTLAIHPHPTLSETLMEAAGISTGRCVHLQPQISLLG